MQIKFLAFVLATPLVGNAQYTTLSGIPGLDSGNSIADYVNVLYKMSIAIGITLSILIIAYAGLEYMTVDVVAEKKKSKTRITHAIIGLLMLLGTYVVLYQLNPDIVSLKFGGN